MTEEPQIPVAQARAQNRAVFFRYLSILAVLVLGGIGYLGYNDVASHETPCSKDLKSQACVARFCVSAKSAGFGVSRECAAVLGRVRAGEVDLGPGTHANSEATSLGKSGSGPTQVGSSPPTGSTGGGGGPGNGGGSTPGGGQGGAPPGTTTTPPIVTTAKPTVNVQLPRLPGTHICVGKLGGVNC